MRTQLLSGVVVAVAVLVHPTSTSSQTSGDLSRNSLIDVLVWGADVAVDWNGYSPEVRAQAQRFVQRFYSYGAERQSPRGSTQGMVDAARLRYERKLAALSDEPQAGTLAAAFVDRLKPCYEWEGYHDCPEREARFARDYQAAHPNGPFQDYLPLLAAHRWLCAAEAYEYEKQPEDAIRARREFDAAVSIARRSAAMLVRIAADELRARARCFPSQR